MQSYSGSLPTRTLPTRSNAPFVKRLEAYRCRSSEGLTVLTGGIKSPSGVCLVCLMVPQQNQKGPSTFLRVQSGGAVSAVISVIYVSSKSRESIKSLSRHSQSGATGPGTLTNVTYRITTARKSNYTRAVEPYVLQYLFSNSGMVWYNRG